MVIMEVCALVLWMSHKTTIFRDTSSAHQIRQYCQAYKILHSRYATEWTVSTFLIATGYISCYILNSIL